MAISGVKQGYNAQEWAQREAYYIQELDKLEIPIDADIATIRRLSAEIDKLRGEASIELAFQTRKFESLERARKATEKELFLLLKSQKALPLKTIDEVNGAVAIAIKDIPAQDVLSGKGFQLSLASLSNALNPVSQQTNISSTPASSNVVSLVTACLIAQERKIFMEHVLDILKDKASALITIEGGLKLEADVTSMANRGTSMANRGNNMADEN